MPGNGSGRYKVECASAVLEALRRIYRLAKQQGRGPAVTEALRQIVDRLQRDPAGAGEPLYPLPALRLRLRTIAVRPLVAHFGIDEDRPIVYLKLIILLGEQES